MTNEIQVTLQPKQVDFFESADTYPVTFYGGAKGGGKSYGLRNIILGRRFKYPGTAGAIFRKSYPELEANHIRPIFAQHPLLNNKKYWNGGKKLLTLPNGSTLQFCHCRNEADLDLYQGREFHDLGVDEIGQWRETMFRKLHGSNRSSIPGIKPRTLLTGNPGGIGHKWLKRLFIEKRFNERECPEHYNFIQALVDDNAALIDNDPDYLHRLESEPNEALRAAYRFGSWDIFAGQYFGEIDRTVHVIRPFDIPHHWNRFGAYDYGFNHPAAFGFFAVSEDGDVFLHKELVEAQLRVDQFAAKLKTMPGMDLLQYIVAGWDCWAKKGVIQQGTSPTIAEEFMKHEIFLTKAKIDRIQGAAQVRNYLAWQNHASGRKRPKLFIFDTCPVTFDCLARMEHDPDRVEDVLKIDAEDGDLMSGDDAYDMLRYGLMSRPMLSDQLKILPEQGTKEHSDMMDKQAEDHLILNLKKARDMEDGQGMSWEVGDDMVPEWNKW